MASHVDLTHAFTEGATILRIVINTATIVMNDSTAAIVIPVMLGTTVISLKLRGGTVRTMGLVVKMEIVFTVS